MMASWRTTAAGLVAGGMMAGPEVLRLLESPDVDAKQLLVGIVVAILGVISRDDKVSSEKAGANK